MPAVDMKFVLSLVFKIWLVACIVGLVLVLTQDIQIFPALLSSMRLEKGIRTSELPSNTESFFVTTADGASLEIWKYRSSQRQTDLKGKVAIIFHGNGETVDATSSYLHFFADLGITSYSFDYRGYGRSTGWPSESGLYQDAEAVLKFVIDNEKINAKNLVILGNSIGTAIAAEVATKFKPHALVLLAPYKSLTDVVQARPIVGLLTPFLMYDLPTADYVSNLQSTCLIVSRGLNDHIISPESSKLVFEAYKGTGYKELIDTANAGHNNLFYLSQESIERALSQCD